MKPRCARPYNESAEDLKSVSGLEYTFHSFLAAKCFNHAQAATRVGVTLKEGFEVHGDRVSFDAKSGLWTVTSAEARFYSQSC